MTPYRERREAGYYKPGGRTEAAAEKTVAELKDELREKDLPVSGTKDELLARLNEGE